MNRWSDILCSVDGFWTASMNHLWQATLFATFVTALLLSLRHIPALIRYILCLIASFKFLLSSALLVSLLKRLGFDLESFFFDIVWIFRDPKWIFLHQQQQFFPVGEIQHSVLPLFGLSFWILGTTLVFRRWFVRQKDFSQKVRSAKKLAGFEKRLQNLTNQIGLVRPPELRTSLSISEPGVWGVFRPVIVIPEAMLQRLTRKELEAVLLHELIHIARHDNLVAHLNMTVCALFWFHPLVWWLDRQMLAEREIICDARVVEITGATPDYRNGLLKVLRAGSGLSVAGVSCAGGGNFRKRIRTLMTERIAHSRFDSLQVLLPVLAVILIALALTFAATPVLPCEGGIWFQLTVSQKS